MNKEILEYIDEKSEEVMEICKDMGYSTRKIDMDEVSVPTIEIILGKNSLDDEITVTCNLVPIVLDDVPALFIQFYICVSDPVSEYKTDIINEYIKAQNEMFMIGNILNFNNAVCAKYSIYLYPHEKIDKDIFARSLDVFVYQANILAKKVSELLDGTKTVQQQVEEGTLF